MLEPPKLADTAILAALQADYSLSVANLIFLPIGNDLASSVYRVETTGGTAYFLKVRARADFRVPSLTVPRFLHDQGVPHIVAPLPTKSGALWVGAEDFALVLYPFLDTRTAASAGLTEQQWRTFGATMRQIHDSRLPDELDGLVRRETLIPWRRAVLDDLDAAVARDALDDPIRREFAAFWRARQEPIRAVVARCDGLAARLRAAAPPLALCHADLHTWNVLVDTRHEWWIVDWDEVILAPKERDLMFVVGGIGRGLVSPRETASFLQGYSGPPIDRAALVYYRYAWAVQDMAAYGEELFFLTERSEESRRAALDGFINLFEPGNIIAIARESDDVED